MSENKLYFKALKILDNEGDPDWCKGMDCGKELKRELIRQYKERLMREMEEKVKNKKRLLEISKYAWKKMRKTLENL